MTEESAAIKKSKLLLEERTNDKEVFGEMDIPEIQFDDEDKYAYSIKLQFPKFSKGFTSADFQSFINTYIGIDNLEGLGRLAYPNEWQMQLKNLEIREKLIRMGRTKINMRSCWISPLKPTEARGYVHWLPVCIKDQVIIDLLKKFGDVILMERQKNNPFGKANCDSRYFAMSMKTGRVVDDVPHFIKIDGYRGLITIKGRKPACFHCKEIGHKKTECKKYREKLSDYCLRPPTDKTRQREKKRGVPFKPVASGAKVQCKKKKKSKSKANKIAVISVAADNTVNVDVKEKESESADDASKTNSDFPTSDMDPVQLSEELTVLKKAIAKLLTTPASGFGDQIEKLKKFMPKVDVPNKVVSNTLKDTPVIPSLNSDNDKDANKVSEKPNQFTSNDKKRRSRKKKKNGSGVPGLSVP